MVRKNKITIEELNSSNSSESTDSLSVKNARELSGISCLGLMPPTVIGLTAVKEQRYFITLALPHKEKVPWNNRKIEYRMLKTREQHIYLSKVVNLLDDICSEYMVIYEHCLSGDLHCHITCTYRGCRKDLKLDVMRHFDIKPTYINALDVREIYDEDHLKNYLLEKDKKKYQTSSFPKIEKKPIEDFN